MSEKFIANVYGQLTSGYVVGVPLETSTEAEKLQEEILKKFQTKVKYQPSVVWINEVEFHKGFLFSLS